MALDNLIAGSYGREDYIFSKHELDRRRALESIKVANEEGVGFNDFINRHRQYLEEKGCSAEHIEKQIARVKDIENYFSVD